VALEAYIPSTVELEGGAIPDVIVITLYQPDSDAPRGSLTGAHPIEAGQSGRMVFVGTRDGKEWRVTLPRIEISNKTALGCEYQIRGPVQREMLRDLGEVKKHEKALEERFDIR